MALAIVSVSGSAWVGVIITNTAAAIMVGTTTAQTKDRILFMIPPKVTSYFE
jgi:hypothetical protein